VTAAAGDDAKGERLMPKIKPLHDKVLVERLDAQEKTSGGIVLPDSAKEKPTEGRVIAVGTGKVSDKGERIPLGVKPGDKVLFGSFAGTAVKEAGKEFLILEEHDLLGVIDDAAWPGSSGKGGSKPADKSAKKK
jgi:chaperonin GroES